jgi:hypothetical protein
MIGIFVLAGDTKVSQIFYPYKKIFSEIIEKSLGDKKYGEGIDLILIEYHLEGKFLPLPEYRYKVNAFRKKERSISVNVYVPIEFEAFSDSEKKEFISQTAIEAVTLVMKKTRKSERFSIDFDALINDLTRCSDIYTRLEPND